MKAAVVVANEDVQYQETEEPEVTRGTVKIKVRYSGICGSDIPRVLNHGVHFYPIVLGHEFSGDVVEVGEGVTKVKVGDRVSGAPLLPCMKCDDCQQGNFSLCKLAGLKQSVNIPCQSVHRILTLIQICFLFFIRIYA